MLNFTFSAYSSYCKRIRRTRGKIIGEFGKNPKEISVSSEKTQNNFFYCWRKREHFSVYSAETAKVFQCIWQK